MLMKSIVTLILKVSGVFFRHEGHEGLHFPTKLMPFLQATAAIFKIFLKRNQANFVVIF